MKLIGIVKKYGETTALNIPALELEAGKVTAVLGESGAGKTTLLNVLSDTTSYEGAKEGTMSVSYLFQDAKLLPHLTVEENLRFVLARSEWGKIGGMLARVGLQGKERRLPASLSGGEKQRVAIARAFLYPHDTLLMDEPFSSLDLRLKQALIGLVRSLWEESRETVVFVTHDVREAILLADRAVVLREGRICGDLQLGGPYGFFEHPPVETALIRLLMGEVAD